ncbi:putative nitrilotriacetate monooxygenase component A [Xylariales sp. PMI_506]|nr:putative nitrilotriacetate monooxygenase component A [Xylariales sp. PMI_506]
MTNPQKKLHLAAFVGAPGWSQIWRHPEVHAQESLDINHFIEFAQLAEKAKFDTIFVADGASFPGGALAQHLCSVSAFEPATLLSAVATHTKNIGLIYTASVSDNEPTHVARQLASLDHISRGRAGWNVVTSPGPGGRNLGIPNEDGKAKYVRARAFYDAVAELWDSYEDDALIRNKETGIFIDMTKVHPPSIDDGLYKISQALTVERPPQGYPVIAQAGTSPEGMSLGGAIADFIYCANYSIEDGQKTFQSLKKYAAAAGRNPDHLLVMTGVCVIWGETQEEADRKLQEIISLWPIEVAVKSLAFNFEGVDLDSPFPDTSDQDVRSKGRANAITSFARAKGLTIRQAAQLCAVGLGHRTLAGTTQSIADDLQAWLEASATDGFVIQPLHIEGLRDFSEHIVPELVRRGIFRSEYEGKTLRENLGVPRPSNRHAQGR